MTRQRPPLSNSVSQPSRAPGSRWSIVNALVWGFGSLVVAAAGVALFLGLESGYQNTAELLTRNAGLVVSSMSRRVLGHLEPARAQARIVARVIVERRLETDVPDDIVSVMRASFTAAPQLAVVRFFGTDGRSIRAARKGSEISVKISNWRDDVRLAEWLEHTQRTGQGMWGDIVYSESLDDAVIFFREPVHREGEFVGFTVAAVTTRELSRYLKELAESYGVSPFILLGSEEVVAYPDLANYSGVWSEGSPLPKLDQVTDPVLKNIWNTETRDEVAEEFNHPGYELHAQKVLGERYVFVVERVDGIGSIPWIIGCYFSEKLVAGVFDRLRYTGLIGLAVLIVALIAVLLFGRELSRPILRLAQAASVVRRGDLQQVATLPPSRLTEVDAAAQAFNEMVEGLKDRELIRETFGKYVPESIADRILTDRGVLTAQTRITTTLFTDIVGFSTVSEDMTPERLIETLNEYFAAVVEPIDRNGGVIHQFQGDAILATYNLPVEDPEHATRAVQTALEIQEVTRGRKFGEGVELATRVGINTGTAVCGTVGSGGRLGFTVHGDEVNLAARIEQMNKQIGTRILVAESTVELAGERFEFIRVAELPVRGRRRNVVVYRLVGPHNEDEVLVPPAQPSNESP